jgi:hypothetical protein
MQEHIDFVEYNAETGVSRMKKSNKYGTFEAVVKLQKEDSDIANRWDGIAFCEYKIDTMVAKKKMHILHERVNAIRAVIKAIDPPEPGEDDYTWDKLLIQYHDACERYEKAKSTYNTMKQNYRLLIDNTLGARRDFRKRAARLRGYYEDEEE